MSLPMTRGYALPLVFGLTLLLSVTLTTVLFGVGGSVSVGESLLHRRQAFHAAEGVSLAAMELASQKLRALPLRPALPPSDPGFPAALAAMLEEHRVLTQTFVNDNKGLFTPAGYTVENIALLGLGAAGQKQLDNGPFNGMLAQVQPVSMSVVVRRDHNRTPATQFVTAQIERATISMFQFYVFSDVYLDLDPGGVVRTSGRIHTNEDFCVAGEPEIGKVTAAGRILMSNRDGQQCRRRATEANTIVIATDDSATPGTAVLTRDHLDASWAGYARSTFNGHVLDSAHNVGKLKMPVTGKPRVQAGVSVLAQEQIPAGDLPADRSLMVPIARAKEDNTTNMRFLVDPMLVSEPEDVRQQKFAFQADVRIIDGVWFLRRPADPTNIGEPIWSDHPGDGVDSYIGNENDDIINSQTGQEDIRGVQGWTDGTPQRYSYYGFKEVAGPKFEWDRAGASPRAVLSYGLLKRQVAGSDVFWDPGHYGAVPADPLNSQRPVAASTTLQHFLDGSLSGIKNGWLEVRSESEDDVTGGVSATETKRSRMLPINFDVAAFLGALQDCNDGELGSFFTIPGAPGGCGGGRTFNGIVYISATWPGSMDGLGDTFATTSFARLAPYNGRHASAVAADHYANPALPMPLCFGATGSIGGIDTSPTTFERCTSISRASANAAFPNMVRVINAQHISPRVGRVYAGISIPAQLLPKGLTIATNLPIVAVGDINVDTTPIENPNDTIPASDHFVPFLIAGDRFHRHSKNWDDAAANWVQLMSKNVRAAEDTTQFIEILAGWNPTPSTPLTGHDHSSDGFEDFPRYNETWGSLGKKATTFGSIVVAFASVYERSGANNGDGDVTGFTTSFPNRDEGFDFHLEDPTVQPPGTPQLVAQSVGFWQAR
ncbi:MAG: hypothetical protein Q8O67_01095 [Deltaproteobacteria bacterium]|nr:hypothetical protein [Deltaproteobacteria bacterium]